MYSVKLSNRLSLMELMNTFQMVKMTHYMGENESAFIRSISIAIVQIKITPAYAGVNQIKIRMMVSKLTLF